VKDLVVMVAEVEGTCPVYRIGGRFVLRKGYKLQSAGPVCMHALASLLPYYVALSKGVRPDELGLGKGDTAYVQCLDPCAYTGGGTVAFCVRIMETENGGEQTNAS